MLQRDRVSSQELGESCHRTLRGRKKWLGRWRMIRDIFYSLFLEQRLSTCES